MMTLSFNEAFLTFFIMTAGAIVHCSVGFGLALIVVPLLILVKPEAVPGPVIFSVIVLSVIISRNNLKFIDLSGLKFALIGRVPGSIAGAFAISIIPINYLSVVLGSLIIIANTRSTHLPTQNSPLA